MRALHMVIQNVTISHKHNFYALMCFNINIHTLLLNSRISNALNPKKLFYTHWPTTALHFNYAHFSTRMTWRQMETPITAVKEKWFKSCFQGQIGWVLKDMGKIGRNKWKIGKSGRILSKIGKAGEWRKIGRLGNSVNVTDARWGSSNAKLRHFHLQFLF